MSNTATANAQSVTAQFLAQHIDHTKLTFGADEQTPDAQQQAIQQLCHDAKTHHFAAVCVRPQWIPLCKTELAGTDVKIATVIGFPKEKVALASEKKNPTVGNFSLIDKLTETQQALKDGANEFDLVMNVAQFKTDWIANTQKTLEEFKVIQNACGDNHVKVIIETDLLSEAEIIAASLWCAEAQVAMVKTSTGMVEGGVGGTPEAVGFIQTALDSYAKSHPDAAPLQIKASGGIKTLEQAIALIEQGVSRLGTSSGLAIIKASASHA